MAMFRAMFYESNINILPLMYEHQQVVILLITAGYLAVCSKFIKQNTVSCKLLTSVAQQFAQLFDNLANSSRTWDKNKITI